MDKYLKNLLIRSDKAYTKYKNNPTYYNAKHIYSTNILIYEFLNQELSNDNSTIPLNELINYIFHLEDWFLLFEYNEKDLQNLDQEFIFESFEDSISFPKYFKI